MKQKINRLLRIQGFVLCMCIITVSLSAQSITVTGKVTGTNSAALPGAAVTVKGSTARALSDANGDYSISVPDRSAVLVFSLTGYAPQEITVNGQTEINVSLSSGQAQNSSRSNEYVMEGTVYDETGAPFEGVTIYIKDKVSRGTLSDSKGRFTIKAERGSVIIFSFAGYAKIEYLVAEEKKDMAIHLAVETEEMDEVVVTAIGTQRKISNVGAVTVVDPAELQIPAPSIANMLGGRVAGIINLQSSGEPGSNLAEFWVRGIGTFGANDKALVLIDGLEGNLNDIDPADVESFSVLKDASATAVYGVRGANGVVLITTKRGKEGKLNITARVNFSLSHLVRIPEYLGGYDYALLVNEARELRNEEPVYDEIELRVIKDNLDPDLYPNVNWQDVILNRNSFKKTYFASLSGGGSLARYYASLGMSDETGAYKVEKTNPYASNAGYKTYTFRMNLNVNLTKTTELYFGSDMSMSVHSLPGQASTAYVWQAQSRLTPLLVPVQYSNGDLPTGSTALSTYSPYVMINHTGKHAVSTYKSLLTMSLNQDLSPITQGLRIRVQGAYNRDGTLTETRYAMPNLYRAEGRNNKGELITRKIVNERKVTYSHGIQGSRKFHLESTLTYDRAFGRHRTSGLVYYYMSDQQATKDMTSSSLSGIPVRYQGLSSRITYGYRDTYLVDFNFGYTGSENFMPGKQFGFFPSIAGGWVPTQYQWVKEKMSWLSFLKIRGSYGTVGNDRIGGTRFPYLTRMSQGTTAPWGTSVSRESIGVSSVGADNLQWERAIKSNLGIDIEMFDKMLTLTADFFNDQRNGIFQPRVQIPDYVGLITNPYGNVGKMKSWGSDGNISFTHMISKDMSFTLRGNYTFSQNLVQNWEQVNQAHPYLELSGMPHNAVRGYQVAGFYQDEDDIRYSPTQNFGGQLRPGDLKYKDTNGDGKINTNDRVPLSFRQMYPLLMYGFGGEFRYKKFSIGILMKGTGKVDYFRNDWGYIPLHGGETGNILAVFQNPSNRWIPREYAIAQGMDPAVAENPNALVPRLQYGANSNNAQLSDFWKGDARYLRLRDVTISYHMDNDFLKRAGIASVDLQLLGNNLYVWDKVKVFEPEQASSRGEVYPIPMVISFQMFIRL